MTILSSQKARLMSIITQTIPPNPTQPNPQPPAPGSDANARSHVHVLDIPKTIRYDLNYA